ncbi:MAG: glycoside hydrolase family 9 protein [Polyangiaceae bacterium]|nr:glycoside hydrolase family 9 protein [Polyangiaceae bacterium]
MILRRFSYLAFCSPLFSSLTSCAPQATKAAASPGSSATAALSPQNNLLKNSTFEDGTSLPWTTSFSAPATGEASVKEGALCLNVVEVGKNPWDAQVRHREMILEKGHAYSVSFVARANRATKVRAKIGMAGPPYAEYWTSTIDLTTAPRLFQGGFTMASDNDPTAELAFHVGGNLAAGAPLELCVDDVSLSDPAFTAKPREHEQAAALVRVNQVGYFPKREKLATLVSPASSSVDFSVVDADGAVVQTGKTKVFGLDRDSGEPLHIIDFSTLQKPGAGYRVRVGTEESPPFKIANDLYAELKYDALAYFYHNRSGIEIKLPFVKKAEWARPAGHLSDSKVSCAKDAGCSYSLDVSGGWYDAGDHGKYVVNGGISVWTLLNLYERAHKLHQTAAFHDGKLSIPENSNQVPDLLDEARFELEFFMKMQVPEGNPLSGMVHHKIHDEAWTALGMAPHESQMKRYLRPVSTAATLNTAATLAQAARLYGPFDKDFAAKCLKAAERAWRAAEAHPDMIAPASDSSGGGAYDDPQVSDDFYWAAAELFITTGNAVYRDFLVRSPHHKSFTMNAGSALSSMNWARTDTLGKLSLLTAESTLSQAERTALEIQLTTAAEEYLATAKKQGYGLPFQGGSGGRFPWGSNSFVLNNLIILGAAYDLSHDQRFLAATITGMDYLLGRNPMSLSYVTGYGEHAVENPHHRFWSHQVNAKYPMAPPGAISGGPNSGLEDPYVKAAGLKGCAPEKCYVDNIEAWSVNEITINWNAPLAWVTAFLDQAAR